MKLSRSPSQEELANLAIDAARLIASGQFDALLVSYPYALAFGRDPLAAIREDLGACLKELGAATLSLPQATPIVQYFESNTSGLLASVACQLPAGIGHVLLELVVTASEGDAHVSLEQLTAVA